MRRVEVDGFEFEISENVEVVGLILSNVGIVVKPNNLIYSWLEKKEDSSNP
jgi:hypothetical protein